MKRVRHSLQPVQRCIFVLAVASFVHVSLFGAPSGELAAARDRQDLHLLDVDIQQLRAEASKPGASAATQYNAALAYSYAAEVAMELHDKRKSANYAESGIEFARKAVDEAASDAEYHRLLGEMCGQVIPANPLLGALKYGQCARDELNKAIELDNRLAIAYVSRGVGNYYLPASMGGGPDLAIKDFQKAIALNSQLADAYLWEGLAFRKENRNGEARQALEHALAIDPQRAWIKQELDKTPGR